MEESYCSDCKSVKAVISDHSTGDTICCDCGLVLEAYLIDEKSEWRTFSDEPANNDPHRVGDKSNPLLSNIGLTTLISMPKGGEYQSQYPSSNSFRRFNHANVGNNLRFRFLGNHVTTTNKILTKKSVRKTYRI
ncbi:hypothetical protein MKW98_014137, partial [Papaver atlanticum]